MGVATTYLQYRTVLVTSAQKMATAERMTRLHVKLLDGQTLSIEVDCATQTADGVLATIVDAARAADRGGPQSIGSQQQGGPPTAVGAGLRLVLAGRHIAGDQPLAAFNVDQQSELHIVLRQAPDPHAELRAALATPACGLLSGYEEEVCEGRRPRYHERGCWGGRV